jgi:hypothetical protein
VALLPSFSVKKHRRVQSRPTILIPVRQLRITLHCSLLSREFYRFAIWQPRLRLDIQLTKMPLFKGLKTRFRRQRALRAANRVQEQPAALYKPLDSNRSEIRLVTLIPGNFVDDIRCSLSTASLNDGVSYEALSYVWGDPGSTRQIIIDGLPARVTDNLETALRYLRYVSRPRVLWIDAICINQRDVPERNTQVMHMGGVYKLASRVIAWLGEEDTYSNLACDTFESLPTDVRMHWDPQKNDTFEEKLLDSYHQFAMQNLFGRPWWYRVWTVQESILGQDLFLVCGHREMSANTLGAISQSYYQHARSCCREFFWDENEEALLKIMDILIDLWQWRRASSRELLDLLAKFRTRHCTDPRDKVYGLLGLCVGDERNMIVPDYSVSVSMVYEHVTLKLIEISRSLDVFSQVFPRSFKSTELESSNLPSWVPNWTLETTSDEHRALTIRQQRNPEYNASSGTFASVRCVDQGKISLKGILIGAVATLSISQTSRFYLNIDQHEEWRDIARIDTFPDRLYGTETSTTYYDAYWQTLCASIVLPRSSLHDWSRKIRTSDNTQRSWHDAWWDWVSKFDIDNDRIDSVSSEYTGSEIAAFNAGVYVSTMSRKLFRSEGEKWLGLAPMDAEAGDTIALLEGGPVPYILRPMIGEEAGCYELIGDAYVHGLMDGEGWEPDLLQEIILL